MIINTWINNELITIDTEKVWLEVFSHWDSLVETDIAAAIATAVVKTLEAAESDIIDSLKKKE